MYIMLIRWPFWAQYRNIACCSWVTLRNSFPISNCCSRSMGRCGNISADRKRFGLSCWTALLHLTRTKMTEKNECRRRSSKQVPTKTQSQLLFSIAHHQTATKCCNLWHSDLKDNCEACDYAFLLTCVMHITGKTFQTSYNLAINKTVEQ